LNTNLNLVTNYTRVLQLPRAACWCIAWMYATYNCGCKCRQNQLLSYTYENVFEYWFYQHV